MIPICLIALPVSCNSQQLDYSVKSPYGEFKSGKPDSAIIKDFIALCNKEMPQICELLKINFDNSIVIEVYHSQEAYNTAIINSEFINSPAISGHNKIQVVSPLSGLEIEKRIGKISYNDRMYFMIHEYVHILIDKLPEPPPICIDEGIASYISSYAFYKEMAQKYVKQINYIPTINQLLQNYDKIPAPDLFSFLLIDYIVRNQGKNVMADLLINPELINKENERWIEFVKKQYY